jgi:hypothetical protein
MRWRTTPFLSVRMRRIARRIRFALGRFEAIFETLPVLGCPTIDGRLVLARGKPWLMAVVSMGSADGAALRRSWHKHVQQ